MYKTVNSVQVALSGLATQTTNILNSLLFSNSCGSGFAPENIAIVLVAGINNKLGPFQTSN